MGARADRVNRVLLALLGLLLLAAGVAGLLVGSGALGDDLGDRRVLPDDTARFVDDNAGWLWPVAAAVGLLLALIALRWLLAQLRTDRVEDIDLTEYRNRGEVHVDAAALTDALVDAVEQCPGVDSASARLIRVRGRDQLLLHVRLAERTDLAEARQALADGPLADLRRVLGDDAAGPDVRVELEPSAKGSGRVLA
jgi:hypothetical protein